MIRKGRYKYTHYIGFEAELFDLESDPDEEHNLAADPLYVGVVRDYEAAMRAIVDLEEIDIQANAAQKEMIEKAGGLEQVLANLVTTRVIRRCRMRSTTRSAKKGENKMFEDRVVLLTHARHFAEPGAAIVCQDEEFTDAGKRNAFENEFPGTIAVATQEPEDVVGAALDEQGRIDALISNDAYPAVRAPVDEADKEEMRRAMEALVVWPHR